MTVEPEAGAMLLQLRKAWGSQKLDGTGKDPPLQISEIMWLF